MFVVGTALSAPNVDEIVSDETENAQSAQFMPPMMMNPMMMDPMMGMGINPMMNYPGMMGGGMYPGMGMNPMMPPMFYSENRDDYPIDYNQGCSSSCSCMQTCKIYFWMPCNCRCPPPCPPPP